MKKWIIATGLMLVYTASSFGNICDEFQAGYDSEWDCSKTLFLVPQDQIVDNKYVDKTYEHYTSDVGDESICVIVDMECDGSGIYFYNENSTQNFPGVSKAICGNNCNLDADYSTTASTVLVCISYGHRATNNPLIPIDGDGKNKCVYSEMRKYKMDRTTGYCVSKPYEDYDLMGESNVNPRLSDYTNYITFARRCSNQCTPNPSLCSSNQYFDMSTCSCNPCPCMNDKDGVLRCGNGSGMEITSCKMSTSYTFVDPVGNYNFTNECEYSM